MLASSMPVVLLLLLLAVVASATHQDTPDDRAGVAPRVEVPGMSSSCPGRSDCRRQRALQGHSPRGVEDANDIGAEVAEDDPVLAERALHDARRTEDPRRGDDGQDEDIAGRRGHQEEDEDHGVQEGRGKQRTKLKKMDATVLQGLLALKMMPLMLISSKVAVLSFMVQLKSLVLAMVSTAIAAVQFFWRFQEKRQRNSSSHLGVVGGAPHVHHLQATPAAAAAGLANGWEDQSMWPDRRKYISF